MVISFYMKRILFVFVFFISIPLFSQNKAQTICGEYVYSPPTNVSVDEAIKTAIQRAKIAALAERFGTLISQNNATVIKNEDGKSRIDFTSLGESEVKGEWIEDIKSPETKVSYENEMLVIKASVCGKAREIRRAVVDFSVKILQNGTESKFESEKFKDGDDFYLFFKSPVNGYLAVYLIDNEQKAFCLLPYKDNASGKTHIDHGKEYIFFSKNHCLPEDVRTVEEYQLTAEKEVEYNQVYIIFSPNEFTKANDGLTSNSLPRELPFIDFQRWLVNCRNRDNEIRVESKTIEIRNNR
jgi:hypothetical protein